MALDNNFVLGKRRSTQDDAENQVGKSDSESESDSSCDENGDPQISAIWGRRKKASRTSSDLGTGTSKGHTYP